MVPWQDGYYWVILMIGNDQQIVQVKNGEVFFMGLQCRIALSEVIADQSRILLKIQTIIGRCGLKAAQ